MLNWLEHGIFNAQVDQDTNETFFLAQNSRLCSSDIFSIFGLDIQMDIPYWNNSDSQCSLLLSACLWHLTFYLNQR